MGTLKEIRSGYRGTVRATYVDDQLPPRSPGEPSYKDEVSARGSLKRALFGARYGTGTTVVPNAFCASGTALTLSSIAAFEKLWKEYQPVPDLMYMHPKMYDILKERLAPIDVLECNQLLLILGGDTDIEEQE